MMKNTKKVKFHWAPIKADAFGDFVSSIDSLTNMEVGGVPVITDVNEIRKLLDSVQGEFEMAIEGSQLIVRHQSTVLMIRLIEGKYPNYKQLIPQNLDENILINREALLSSLKRVSLF